MTQKSTIFSDRIRGGKIGSFGDDQRCHRKTNKNPGSEKPGSLEKMGVVPRGHPLLVDTTIPVRYNTKIRNTRR